MRLRSYISNRDYEYLKNWVSDEKVHALWCANMIPYPITKESLNEMLNVNADKWEDCTYVVTEDDGRPIGFFVYSVKIQDNSGFFKFIVLDNELRGRGYGTEMLKLALRYAYDITGVSSVQLNVFDVNDGAKKCYLKVGFTERSFVKEAFTYKDEKWGRYNMVISR